MKVTEVIVSAGRTFNHPHESYSNLKPQVTMKATLEDGEDPVASAKKLQAQCEELVEDHKRNMLKSLEDLYDLTERQKEMMSLRGSLEKAQARLSEIREHYPQLEQVSLPLAGKDDQPF